MDANPTQRVQAQLRYRWSLENNGYTGGRRMDLSSQRGFITAVQNPKGGRTSYAYDASSNIKRIQDAGGRITTYQVDANDNLTKVIQPDGRVQRIGP